MDKIHAPSTAIGVKKWHRYAAMVFSSFCLLIPAFLNHYPLVNPDTATYLTSGFMPAMPFDRPITYGILTRILTLKGLSLWLLVFAQGYILSWLIFKIFKNVANDKPYVLKSTLVVFLLSVCTSLSWIVSQVQPDMFTAVAFLCMTILLTGKESRKTNIILYLLFFFAVATHFSHPVLMIGMLIFLFLCSPIYTPAKFRPRDKFVVMFILSLLSILVMITPLGKSSHVFMVGSLLEKGVLKKYLDDNCSARNYKICAYKDALPADVNQFWWDPASPLYKIGDWKGAKPEFKAIIADIFTTPRYQELYISATCRQVKEQAMSFQIGDGNQSFPEGSYVYKTMAEYFPRELSMFNSDRQNNLSIMAQVTSANKVFNAVIAASFLVLVYAFARWRNLSSSLKLLLIVCISGIIFNCLDCAAFGIVNGRFGCKMIWLLPFCAMVIAAMPKAFTRNDQTTQ